MLIFSTDQSLDVLSKTQYIFGDGTFCLAPTNFKQIYVLKMVHVNSRDYIGEN